MTQDQRDSLAGYHEYIPMHEAETPEVYIDKSSRGIQESFDWRTRGKVTAVKNMGTESNDCQAGYAAAGADAIESAYAIAGKPLTVMSTQQQIDCTRDFFNFGCMGGHTMQSFQWYETSKVMTEEDYPYTGREGQCQHDEAKGVAYVVEHVQVKDKESMLNAVKNQPVTIYFEGVNQMIQQYQSGIITDQMGKFWCSGEGASERNAGVIIGWGQQDSLHYFIVKNSWGEDWGEEGYFRIESSQYGKYRDGGVCGIYDIAYYPVINLA